MLRSTGFFRGIECPFDTEICERKGVRNGCNRPYCLFRHSRGSRSNGAQAHRGTRDIRSARTEQGYDPFHPEVNSERGHQNGEPSGHLSGELDMVNKAIEEVRCEMERDKRKLSRIGDEPYDPSQSALASLVDSAESRAAGSHLAYDPGSYEITTAGYNPTPGCSKYTMVSDNPCDSNSMEYDPMSNYSTRVLGKHKREDQKNIGKVGKYEVQSEGRDRKRLEDKMQVKTGKKIKTDRRKRDRDPENGAIKSKKNKEQHKDKDKNGKLERGKREKNEKKFSKNHFSSGALTNLKDIERQSSRTTGKRLTKKRLSLSHADLFGDESPDETNPITNYDNATEVQAGQSPRATKKSCLNKSTAPKWTQASSEDNDAMEHSRLDSDIMFSSAFIDDDLDFSSDPTEECLRIFNESNDVKREDKGRQAKQVPSNLNVKSTESTLTTLFPGQKRRVSHCVAKGNNETPSSPVAHPPKRPSAQEVCYQRMQKAQQQAAQLTASHSTPSEGLKHDFLGRKKRASFSLSSQMTSSQTSSADARPAASPQSGGSDSGITLKSQTTAGILSKTSSTVMPKRVAHTPTMKSTSLRRPVIPSEFGAKVPNNIRQRYLNNFIDECVKFCPSEDAAHNMALDEERLVYDRSSTKKIYLNIAVNMLKKLRSQSSSIPLPATNPPGLASKKKPQSHQDVLGGRLAATTSFTLNRRGKQQEERLQGATLYTKLKSYLMTEEQLQEHGYPRPNPEAPGRAIINVTAKKVALDRFTKICCRCGAEYKIKIDGNYARKEECSYHWGRLQPRKVAGGWERIYSCCSATVGDPGCQISQQHVQDGRKESLDGYVSTFSKPLPADGNGGMFALDCEMCYTMQGLELTRVTVINSDLKVIYDTFVKPENKVIDYNTRFSGVTKEDLKNTTINLRDVQAVLLSMFSAESILIGHSLESDLVALKLIHSTVVDTTIVFPHRLGLPYKRALKNLMADYLKRIIQDDVGGHDSSEDASACMELMIWKIKEDAKVKI